MSLEKNAVKALCLISSCGCNLDCQYCFIAKSNKNKEYSHQLQEKTIQAFDDGSFLQNTKDIFKKLDQDPHEIEVLSFWGQEPTLTMNHFTEHAKDWFDFIPNVQTISFSTNGMAYPERITDLIRTVDTLIDHKTIMTVQFSHDGDVSTDTIRGGNTETILTNVRLVIDTLNKMPLKNVFVRINMHSVLSFEMLHSLNSQEKITQYFLQFSDLGEELGKRVTNENVDFNRTITTNIEAPYDACQQDGIDFCNFITHSLSIDNKNWFNNKDNIWFCGEELLQVIYRFSGKFNGIDGAKTLQQYLQELQDTGNVDETINCCCYCGNNVSEFKIMYDGTLINCQNHIYEREIDNIDPTHNIENDTKRSLVKHHYFLNPLTDSDEAIEKTFYMFDTFKNHSFRFRFNQTLNLMYLLASSGQIKRDYLFNKDKTLRHAFYLTIMNVCSYNYLVKTGSTIIRPASFIRLYCNGVLDLVDDFQYRGMRIPRGRENSPIQANRKSEKR